MNPIDGANGGGGELARSIGRLRCQLCRAARRQVHMSGVLAGSPLPGAVDMRPPFVFILLQANQEVSCNKNEKQNMLLTYENGIMFMSNLQVLIRARISRVRWTKRCPTRSSTIGRSRARFFRYKSSAATTTTLSSPPTPVRALRASGRASFANSKCVMIHSICVLFRLIF